MTTAIPTSRPHTTILENVDLGRTLRVSAIITRGVVVQFGDGLDLLFNRTEK